MRIVGAGGRDCWLGWKAPKEPRLFVLVFWRSCLDEYQLCERRQPVVYLKEDDFAWYCVWFSCSFILKLWFEACLELETAAALWTSECFCTSHSYLSGSLHHPSVYVKCGLRSQDCPGPLALTCCHLVNAPCYLPEIFRGLFPVVSVGYFKFIHPFIHSFLPSFKK